MRHRKVRNITRSISIPLNLLESYEEKAARRGRSTNWVIIEALKGALSHRKRLNEAFEEGRLQAHSEFRKHRR